MSSSFSLLLAYLLSRLAHALKLLAIASQSVFVSEDLMLSKLNTLNPSSAIYLLGLSWSSLILESCTCLVLDVVASSLGFCELASSLRLTPWPFFDGFCNHHTSFIDISLFFFLTTIYRSYFLTRLTQIALSFLSLYFQYTHWINHGFLYCTFILTLHLPSRELPSSL